MVKLLCFCVIVLLFMFFNFEYEELPHVSFLQIRQITKIRNDFANNMPTNIRLSKAQISKMIQSGELLGKKSGKLGKKYC